MSRQRRFPARVYGHWVEPDARFSLANERTFLGMDPHITHVPRPASRWKRWAPGFTQG